MLGILGKKLGMTQIFLENGQIVPVTAIEAGPCPITQIKTDKNDGYSAIQIGFDTKPQKNTTKPLLGHFKKANSKPKRFLHEFRLEQKDLEPYKIGEEIIIDTLFKEGDYVDVSGTSKGRGFTGVMKRHNFQGGKASHGVHEYHRHGGSIGMSSNPARVLKGKKMAGQHGNAKVTTQSLKVAKIDKEKNLILIQGAVPGSINGYVMINKAVKKQS